MFDRVLFKTNAKDVLRNTYWLSFAVTLVAGILGVGGSPNFNFNFSNSGWRVDGKERFFENTDTIFPFLAIFSSFFVIVFLLSLAIRIFVSNPVEVGMRDFFVKARNGFPDFSHLFSSFRKGKYLPVVEAMFLQNLFIFLWSLLLIIPGIIKSYEYYCVPYILSQNPQIGSKRALELSRRMTNGYKADIFVLNLSFLGWILLGLLACCLGVIFVPPYIAATDAEMYMFLKYSAVQRGVAHPAEFGEMDPFYMQGNPPTSGDVFSQNNPSDAQTQDPADLS